jgi:hypothetical protein
MTEDCLLMERSIIEESYKNQHLAADLYITIGSKKVKRDPIQKENIFKLIKFREKLSNVPKLKNFGSSKVDSRKHPSFRKAKQRNKWHGPFYHEAKESYYFAQFDSRLNQIGWRMTLFNFVNQIFHEEYTQTSGRIGLFRSISESKV